MLKNCAKGDTVTGSILKAAPGSAACTLVVFVVRGVFRWCVGHCWDKNPSHAAELKSKVEGGIYSATLPIKSRQLYNYSPLR